MPLVDKTKSQADGSAPLVALLEVLAAPTAGYGYDVLASLSLVATTPRSATFSLPLDASHLNPFGALHGACAALLVDATTTLALVAAGCPPGSSVDLTTQYYSAAREGDVLTVVATVEKRGSSLAYTRCVGSVDGKEVFAGSHVKFVREAKL
ncbi:Acyl-coenzyme A thioesterase 13 [Geranomyces variabilis]|nr:Acyl-coenzyme A thioesterase 13 [Geranomyces variabilis]